jgi:hypothetical protein
MPRRLLVDRGRAYEDVLGGLAREGAGVAAHVVRVEGDEVHDRIEAARRQGVEHGRVARVSLDLLDAGERLGRAPAARQDREPMALRERLAHAGGRQVPGAAQEQQAHRVRDCGCSRA